jgi:hypothetical protein
MRYSTTYTDSFFCVEVTLSCMLQRDFDGTRLSDTTIQQIRKQAYDAFMLQKHQSVNLARPDVDGQQVLMCHYVPVTTVAASIFKDKELADYMHYQPRPVFTESGTRILHDFASGVAWQKLQMEAGPDVTLMLMGVYSDEAKCLSNLCTYGLYGEYQNVLCRPH